MSCLAAIYLFIYLLAYLFVCFVCLRQALTPEAHYVDQAFLRLTEICLLSTGINRHAGFYHTRLRPDLLPKHKK